MQSQLEEQEQPGERGLKRQKWRVLNAVPPSVTMQPSGSMAIVGGAGARGQQVTTEYDVRARAGLREPLGLGKLYLCYAAFGPCLTQPVGVDVLSRRLARFLHLIVTDAML